MGITRRDAILGLGALAASGGVVQAACGDNKGEIKGKYEIRDGYLTFTDKSIYPHGTIGIRVQPASQSNPKIGHMLFGDSFYFDDQNKKGLEAMCGSPPTAEQVIAARKKAIELITSTPELNALYGYLFHQTIRGSSPVRGLSVPTFG